MVVALRRILKTRPALREKMGGVAGGPIIIYTYDGSYVYGIANRKDGLRFYCMPIYMHAGLKRKYGPRFGKMLVGKACVRFRRLEDIDQPMLKALVDDAGKIASVKI